MKSFRFHAGPGSIGTCGLLSLLLCLSLGGEFGLAQAIAPTDTIRSAPSGGVQEGSSGVDTVVVYSASDSITYSLSSRFMKMYGKADIKYREIELKAERVDVNWDTATLVAEGVLDTTVEVESYPAGSSVPNPAKSSFQPSYRKKYRGAPILIDGGEEYLGFRISYNFKTQKGKIDVGDTEIEKGYYHGEVIKKVETNVLFVSDGHYTTCDLPKPHYYFFSPRMKVFVGDKIIAEPVILYIADVPVFAIPFGVFPNKGGRRSGIIAPAYGRDARRGRYLSHLGYYRAISDYMDWNIRGDWYTKGGWALYSDYRYALRYNFTGSVKGEYRRLHVGESDDPDRTEEKSYRLSLVHNQTLSPTTRLDANFTFTTNNSYLTTNNLNQALNQIIFSNATLSKLWEGTNNSLTVNVSRRQNLLDGTREETLPDVRFNHFQSYPFRREQKTRGLTGGGETDLAWYELIGYSYNSEFLRRRRKTKALSGLTTTQGFERDERRGVNHVVSINASPKMGYFTISPFFNYTEKWYDKSVEKTFDPVDSVIVTKDVGGLRAVRFFSAGLSASTKFYGIVQPNILGISAIRQTVTPSVSYNYRPDWSEPKFGYWGTVLDSTRNVDVPYSFFEREVFGGAPMGELQSLNFNVSNLFEMKYVPSDTSEEVKKYQLLLLNANLSYNFAADSLRLSELRLSYRTSVGNVFSLSGNSSFDFYRFDVAAKTRVNKFLIDLGEGLARLTSFGVSVSLTLRGEQKSSSQRQMFDQSQPSPAAFAGSGRGFFGLYEEEQANFSIPWNLNVTWNFNQSQFDPSRKFRSSNIRANLGFSLTQNWKITMSGSYDIINKQVAAPNVNVYRDLHCWEMNFNWVPRGIYRGFRLEIRVKAPQLRDLKVTKQGSARGIF
ncbi:MAG: putative LPS assembly protein LptD [Bacteroidota bacterium]